MTLNIFKQLLSIIFVALPLHGALLPQANAEQVSTVTLNPGAYLNGGIGSDGQAAMRAERQHYNLRLTLALAGSGEYVSGVTVHIKSLAKGGDEFGPFSDCGPLFYVRLRPGTYSIKATYEGETKMHRVRVGTHGVDQVIYWQPHEKN